MEFQKFIQTFNRIDNYCIMKNKPNPFEDLANSSYEEDWWIWICDNPEHAEEIVTEWLKNHPEPQYPTFLEVIQDLISEHPELKQVNINDLMCYNVPPEGAERWGIAPINLEDINEYVKEWV